MRNKMIAIFTIIVFSGCATTELTEWQTDIRSSGYDFRQYTEQGFLFTPEIYTEQYDAIGLVEVTYVPRVMKAHDQQNPANIAGFRNIYVGQTHYYLELPDTDELISEMYNLADGLGADALSNFRITTDTVVNNGYNIETVKITGFAIKRLSN